MTDPEYGALVQAAAAGDERAMESLLTCARAVAHRFSVLVCGNADDAEDCIQDALLKTYCNVSRIRDPDAFRFWLYRIVRNACLMRHRRRVDQPARLLSLEEGAGCRNGHCGRIDVASRDKPPDQMAIDAASVERLRAALRRLPYDYRVIVLLREFQGLSTTDVASLTRISEANVKTRLHRARLMLRRDLSGPSPAPL